MALKMILEKGAQPVKVCADLPRNTMRPLAAPPPAMMVLKLQIEADTTFESSF